MDSSFSIIADISGGLMKSGIETSKAIIPHTPHRIHIKRKLFVMFKTRPVEKIIKHINSGVFLF